VDSSKKRSRGGPQQEAIRAEGSRILLPDQHLLVVEGAVDEVRPGVLDDAWGKVAEEHGRVHYSEAVLVLAAEGAHPRETASRQRNLSGDGELVRKRTPQAAGDAGVGSAEAAQQLASLPRLKAPVAVGVHPAVLKAAQAVGAGEVQIPARQRRVRARITAPQRQSRQRQRQTHARREVMPREGGGLRAARRVQPDARFDREPPGEREAVFQRQGQRLNAAVAARRRIQLHHEGRLALRRDGMDAARGGVAVAHSGGLPFRGQGELVVSGEKPRRGGLERRLKAVTGPQGAVGQRRGSADAAGRQFDAGRRSRFTPAGVEMRPQICVVSRCALKYA